MSRAWYAHKSRRALDELQRELDERRAQISEALSDFELNCGASLEAMLAIVRARDPQSYEHARRVAAVAVNLAMALRITEPQLSDIERAALLHDFGRLALPDALLARERGALSEEERTRLRAYPLHGQAMLRNVPFLAPANAIAVAPMSAMTVAGFLVASWERPFRWVLESWRLPMSTTSSCRESIDRP